MKIFPFMKYKWLFGAVSLVLVIASLYLIFTKGFNFGVDFKGGVKLVYQFSQPTGEEVVRESLLALDIGEVQVVRYDKVEANKLLVKVKFKEGVDLAELITNKLQADLKDNQVTLESSEDVGPKVGQELRRQGFLAMVLTWALILIYVGVRFDFLFAPGAIIALIHDVIIPCGVFSLLQIEFNLPILAALLTIIGYSINDTIVIDDRIRENLKKLSSKLSLPAVIDQSLTETLSRTIITSLTLFFAVLVLFFLGGAVLHDFSFCMLIGLVCGTYSTIFIASPIYLALNKMFPGKGMRDKR